MVGSESKFRALTSVFGKALISNDSSKHLKECNAARHLISRNDIERADMARDSHYGINDEKKAKQVEITLFHCFSELPGLAR
jgi:hypothetical protein